MVLADGHGAAELVARHGIAGCQLGHLPYVAPPWLVRKPTASLLKVPTTTVLPSIATEQPKKS